MLSKASMLVTALALGLFLLAVPGSTIAAAAQPPIFTGIVKDVAVGGFDPVAYFAEGKPRQGVPEISLEHGGVTWRFVTEANRDTFKADPAKYAPQYGGYCAWAVSNGYTAKGDPHAWTLYEGKLYLNYDKKVRALWAQDIPANVAKGDNNWPGVLEK